MRRRNFNVDIRDQKVEDVIGMLAEERASKALPLEPTKEQLEARAAAKAAKGAQKGGKGGKNKKGGGKKGKGGKNAAAYDGPVIGKIDIRVGKIVKCWPHANPKNDKLWCEEIDCGEEKPRQIASGLRKHYTQEQMTGRRILVVCNLKSAKLDGFPSHGMVLCAKKNEGSTEHIEFVDVPEGAKVGERIFIKEQEGALPDPYTPAQMKKKKIFKKILAPQLKTNGALVATWEGKQLLTSAGPCTVPTLADARIE